MRVEQFNKLLTLRGRLLNLGFVKTTSSDFQVVTILLKFYFHINYFVHITQMEINDRSI
jgi:hypothetical protein